jgi:hypothetical protein
MNLKFVISVNSTSQIYDMTTAMNFKVIWPKNFRMCKKYVDSSPLSLSKCTSFSESKTSCRHQIVSFSSNAQENWKLRVFCMLSFNVHKFISSWNIYLCGLRACREVFSLFSIWNLMAKYVICCSRTNIQFSFLFKYYLSSFYLHTYLLTHYLTYLLTYLPTFLLTYLLILLPTYLLTYLLTTHLLIYFLAHFLTYSLTNLLTYLLTYSM